jgi:hypothetical protein
MYIQYIQGLCQSRLSTEDYTYELQWPFCSVKVKAIFVIATILASTLLFQSQSQSYVTTDGQSASLSWCQAPIWGLRPDFFFFTLRQLRVC